MLKDGRYQSGRKHFKLDGKLHRYDVFFDDLAAGSYSPAFVSENLCQRFLIVRCENNSESSMTIAFVHLMVHFMVQSDDTACHHNPPTDTYAQGYAASLLRPTLLRSKMLHHLLDRRRVLLAVLRPLLCCRWRRLGLGLGLCWRGLWEVLLRVNGLLGHLGELRVRVRLLVRLLIELLVGLLVSLRVRLEWLLSLWLDIWLLLHLSEVELVRLGLRRRLCLCHGLLESRCSLSLRCIRSELSSLWRLILLLLVVVGVATTLALSVTSTTASFATSASTSTTSVVSTTTAAALGIATLLWGRTTHLHLGHVVWALERSVHAVIIWVGLHIIVVVQH
jgi:hypothetical protein